MSDTPSVEDLIELGYLKPGDITLKNSDLKWSPFLDRCDLDYAKRHGLTEKEMKDFKQDMLVEDEILKLHYEMVEKHDRKPHFAW